MKSVETMIADALAAGQKTLSEYDSKKILAEYGIPTTEDLLIDELAAAEQAAEQIGYPVAIKIDSPEISHRNEVGGVALNVSNDDQAREFFGRCMESVLRHRPDAEIHGVGVQPMITAPDGIELIMGSRKDAVFGPVILIGLGGGRSSNWASN